MLRTEHGRKPSEKRRLNATQEKEVCRLITNNLPEQLKLPFALWTRKAVAELLEQQFGLKLPGRTMGPYLKCREFAPQTPIKKAYEQNPKKVKVLLKQEYPQIAAAAKAKGASHRLPAGRTK